MWLVLAENSGVTIDWDRVTVTSLLGVIASGLAAVAYREFKRQQKHAEQCEEAYQALAMYVIDLHTKINPTIELPEKIKELASRRIGRKTNRKGNDDA